jgi:ergothioneine biosynthesis protein EgtB
MVSALADASPRPAESLSDRFLRIRELSLALTAPLAIEDHVVQTMPEVSPTKWHLGHTTWFFERFCLADREAGYRPFDEQFHFLFNSYYQTVGPMQKRPQRGLLSRPTVAEIHGYRCSVDERIARLLAERDDDRELEFLVTLGIHHEQQHQELMLTDIKHVFFMNPLKPVYREAQPASASEPVPLTYDTIDGGEYAIGAEGGEFHFDNETPRHEVPLRTFSLANRLVTNGEFEAFIAAGGYTDPALWLADGWTTVNTHSWARPLYWSEDREREFTLGGWQTIDANAPVTHISLYEADAFARWAGKRLPTEAEWEVAAGKRDIAGNFLESGALHPEAARVEESGGQLYGDVWEWTASAYAPYPGFEPLAGSLGEYNGKFMCNQLVVRGGSCVTQHDHMRASYRSFFYPHDRWQFLGFRLASNA